MRDGEPQTYEDGVPAIPDVRDLPVDAVLHDESALGNTLRRLVAEMVGSDESYAAHNSTPRGTME